MNIYNPTTLQLYVEYKIVNLIEAESRMVIARGCGEGKMGEVMVKVYRISLMKDKR